MPTGDPNSTAPLLPWMRFVLRFVGIYNLLTGLNMLLFLRQGCEYLGVATPEPIVWFQMTGLLVSLFGVGYWLVASHPFENRDLLRIGFCSKLLGPTLIMYHVARGTLPTSFVPLVVVSDLVYLPLFYLILRRLNFLMPRP